MKEVSVLVKEINELNKLFSEALKLIKSNPNNISLRINTESIEDRLTYLKDELKNTISLRDLRIEALEETLQEKEDEITKLKYSNDRLMDDLETSHKLMDLMKNDYAALQESVDSNNLPYMSAQG